MPKLVVQIDHEFQAGPMLARDKRVSETKPLSSKKLKELIAGAVPDDFSLAICLLDPEEGWPMVGFELSPKRLSKGGVFDFTIDEKERVATIKVHGEIATDALRAGVAPDIQKQGKKADFRLQAFNFKGGEWKGFSAPIVGQGEEDFKNWYQIKNWKLK